MKQMHRELGKQLRRQNMTAENCAKGFIISKIIDKLNIPEEEIEKFLISTFFSFEKSKYHEHTAKCSINILHLRSKNIIFIFVM